MPGQQAAEYHKNSLKNVRAALNRHLKDIGCDIDIVKDIEFKAANAMLNAKLKLEKWAVKTNKTPSNNSGGRYHQH